MSEVPDRISNAPPPVPANRNVADILKELKITGRSKERQMEVIAREQWRLRPEEVEWLNDAGLTTLNRYAAELMLKGWSEAAAREASAVKSGHLGGTSGNE